MTAPIEYSLREISDLLAIQRLSAEYTRFADAADGERFAGLFVPDGRFEIRGRVYEGREAIAAVCSSTQNVVHITTNPLVDLDGDEARQSSRIIAARTYPDRRRHEFVATGTYTDQLVRTSAGWRFACRKGELDVDLDVARAALGTS